MDEGRNLYFARMLVRVAGGPTVKQTVYIVADTFKQAEKTAKPTTGHYSFELVECKLVGKAQVAA